MPHQDIDWKARPCSSSMSSVFFLREKGFGKRRSRMRSYEDLIWRRLLVEKCHQQSKRLTRPYTLYIDTFKRRIKRELGSNVDSDQCRSRSVPTNRVVDCFGLSVPLTVTDGRRPRPFVIHRRWPDAAEMTPFSLSRANNALKRRWWREKPQSLMLLMIRLAF